MSPFSESGPAAPPAAAPGLRLVPVQTPRPIPQLAIGPPPTALTGRHVLVIGPGRHDLLGHAARTLDVTRHLADCATSVTLLVGSSQASVSAGEAPGAVHVVHLDQGAARRGSSQHTALTRTACEATRLVSAASGAVPAPPDLVIATSPGLGGVMAGARLARRHHAPLVVLVHDLLAAGRGAGPVGGTLERHALTAADVVAVACEGFRDPVAGYGVAEERIVCLPHWAALDPDGAPPLQRRAARMALGWPARGFQVVTADVGHGQDVATVIEAAQLLEQQGVEHRESARPDVRFIVIGDGTRRGRLGRQLNERVRLRRIGGSRGSTAHRIDDLTPDRLRDALAAADLLVISQDPRAPGSCGTAGMLLTHYLAAGRPVILAGDRDSPAARAVACSSGAGVVVPPGDPAALADAVARLAARAPLRTLMAERAAGYARTALDRTLAMAAIDRIVEQALGAV